MVITKHVIVKFRFATMADLFSLAGFARARVWTRFFIFADFFENIFFAPLSGMFSKNIRPRPHFGRAFDFS